MKKIDLKKELKHLYQPSAKEFTVVDVPKMHYLMVDGEGDPNSAVFTDAVEALYGVSYNLKFSVKKGDLGIDYGVMPLEGLWWHQDMSQFSLERKNEWIWTLMILQPDFITQEMVTQAIVETAKKKKDNPFVSKLRFEEYHEGLAAQIMYIGAYADEAPTIARLHEYIKEQGYMLSGKHHEIYLNDPMRTAPEKLKTVIRQPMVKG